MRSSLPCFNIGVRIKLFLRLGLFWKASVSQAAGRILATELLFTVKWCGNPVKKRKIPQNYFFSARTTGLWWHSNSPSWRGHEQAHQALDYHWSPPGAHQAPSRGPPAHPRRRNAMEKPSSVRVSSTKRVDKKSCFYERVNLYFNWRV